MCIYVQIRNGFYWAVAVNMLMAKKIGIVSHPRTHAIYRPHILTVFCFYYFLWKIQKPSRIQNYHEKYEEGKKKETGGHLQFKK